MQLKQIREDLKDVRYYYSRQKTFDEAVRLIGHNAVLEKVRKYNDAVKTAPPRLYDLYVNLYTKGLTQEGLSIELGYTPEYIQMLNKQLLLFLQEKLGQGGRS